MAINTELPISKVTFDDQEISLASSGGGGEEVIQETFAGSQIATYYAKIRELMPSGKLLSITIEPLSNITYTISLLSLGTDTCSVEDSTTTLTQNYVYCLRPTVMEASRIFFNGNFGTSEINIACTSSDIKIYHTAVQAQTGQQKILIRQGSNIALPLDSVRITLNYFA